MIPLPIRIPPMPDEILTSWIIRIALANGTDPLGIGYGIWEEWRGWTRDIDRHLPETYRKRLAFLTGLEADRIHRMTLEPFIARLYPEGALPKQGRWLGVVPLGTRNRTRINGLHFCPECLGEETAYARRSWRASWVSACPRHKRQLALSCPQCHHPFAPHMVRYDHPHFTQCVRCGFDLTQTETSPADDGVLRVQESLNRSVWDHLPVDAAFPGWFHGEDSGLSEAFRFLNDLLRLFRYIDISPKHSFESLCREWTDECPSQTFHGRIDSIESLPVANRHLYWRMVAQVLRRGEAAFVLLLRSHGITYATPHNAALRSKLASRTLLRIARQLSRTPAQQRKSASCSMRNVTPRSQQQVEHTMQSLRRYL